MARTDDLSAIEPFFAALIASLKPAQQRKLALKMGRYLRRENAARIARNVQPDGSAMEPRKRRAERKSGRVKKRGKMFPKIRKAQALRINARPDGVEVGFTTPLISRTAAIHQFGETGYVGRKPDGAIIRAKYPERILLGFAPDDADALLELALDHLIGG